MRLYVLRCVTLSVCVCECCDNWRGISLLEVVGKVVARIVQNRLQQLAEQVLPELQCGFRKHRGCNDMIFTVWQVS